MIRTNTGVASVPARHRLAQPGLTVWNWQAVRLVVVAVVVTGLAACWIYGRAQRIPGASRVAVALYLGTPYASIGAWWMLDESPGLHHLVGAALGLPGVFLVTVQRRLPPQAAASSPLRK